MRILFWSSPIVVDIAELYVILSLQSRVSQGRTLKKAKLKLEVKYWAP